MSIDTTVLIAGLKNALGKLTGKKRKKQRKYRRLPLKVCGLYELNGCNGRCQLCNISPEGLAVKIYSTKELSTCERLRLKLEIPQHEDSVDIMLRVKWIKGGGQCDSFEYMAGGTHIFDNTVDRTAILEMAYTNWFRGMAE